MTFADHNIVSLPTPVLSAVSELLASERSALSLPPHRHLSRSTRSSRASISTPRSLVLASKSFAKIFSVQPPPQLIVSSPMRRSTSPRSTRSFLLEVPPVFLVSRSSLPITSTVRSPTSPSILMRLLHTVRLSKLPFSLVTLHPSPPTRSSSSTLRRCQLVSRLLVAK